MLAADAHEFIDDFVHSWKFTSWTWIIDTAEMHDDE